MRLKRCSSGPGRPFKRNSDSTSLLRTPAQKSTLSPPLPFPASWGGSAPMRSVAARLPLIRRAARSRYLTRSSLSMPRARRRSMKPLRGAKPPSRRGKCSARWALGRWGSSARRRLRHRGRSVKLHRPGRLLALERASSGSGHLGRPPARRCRPVARASHPRSALYRGAPRGPRA